MSESVIRLGRVVKRKLKVGLCLHLQYIQEGGGGLSLWDVDCVLTPRAALSGVQT